MRFKQIKPLSELPKDKKTKLTLSVVKYITVLIVVIFAVYGVYTFIDTHEFRSPIIFQNPIPLKKLVSPVGHKKKLSIIHTVYTQEKSQIEGSTAQELIRLATIKAFGLGEVDAMNELVKKESSFNPLAQNSHSTAFGLFQFLDSTWSSYGCVKTEDAQTQIDCGVKYIAQRYDTPTKALAFHLDHGWY